MSQMKSPFFDELAKIMTQAAGAAQGVGQEIETLFRSQGEKMLNDMDLVTREEFEAVKEMASKAREQNDLLAQRIQELEAQLQKEKT